MARIDIARRYLEALRTADARAASALFREDGVIDDYVGGHHVGRRGIEAFIGGLGAGRVFVSEPEGALEEADRLTLYGRVGWAAEDHRERVRWIFHFAGDRVSHLGISRVDFVAAG
jgi:hypothetical protein